ncbi:MAG: hypothetical protein EA412_09985 [Chitinophagaceae bacterium]|nr:MAG: hypothetical protein EA412_09985 [Chitinophagaceae bacterium]
MSSKAGFIYLILFVLMFTEISAQVISYSSPQRLSNRSSGIRILGETKEGILVYKAGRRTDDIDIYGSDLRLKAEVRITANCNNCFAHRFYIFYDRVVIFFLQQERNYSVLHYREYTAGLNPIGSVSVLDTIPGNKEFVYDNLRFSISENREYIYYAYPEQESRNTTSYYVHGFTRDLSYFASGRIEASKIFDYVNLHSLHVTNEGKAFLIEEAYENIRLSRSLNEFVINKFNPESPQAIKSYTFIPEKENRGRVVFNVDNFNRSFLAHSYYKDSSGNNNIKGINYLRIDSTFSIAVQTSIPFTGEIIFSLTGRDTLIRSQSLLETYNLYQVVPLYDGGFVTIGESRHDNLESYRGSATSSPSLTPGFRSVNINYFNDILVVAYDKNGNYLWHNVLIKKQISEDDRGFFSSYYLVRTPDRLRLIFNEEIFYQTNINEYIIDEKGRSNRNNIFNSGDRNIMLAPRLGRQISPNTVIIPSFRRNNFRLVKIRY